MLASAAGFPLTQRAIRRHGLPGAALVEVACVGLIVRDSALLAAGAPRQLRPAAACLLWLETVVAAAAATAGVRPLLQPTGRRQAAASRPDGWEALRRYLVATLFALHTIRFRIYLRPDRGRHASAR